MLITYLSHIMLAHTIFITHQVTSRCYSCAGTCYSEPCNCQVSIYLSSFFWKFINDLNWIKRAKSFTVSFHLNLYVFWDFLAVMALKNYSFIISQLFWSVIPTILFMSMPIFIPIINLLWKESYGLTSLTKLLWTLRN